MLVHFQRLLGGVAANELDLGVGQSLGGEPSQHLVPEQVRVDAFRQVRHPSVLRHDLLNAAGGVFRPLAGLEEIAVSGVRCEMGFQREPERSGNRM